MKTVHINMNDKVRVKLNDRGRKAHRDYHDKLFAPNADKFDYGPPKEDAEGWSEWQLHDLMMQFGSYIVPGLDGCPFDTEIEFPDVCDELVQDTPGYE